MVILMGAGGCGELGAGGEGKGNAKKGPFNLYFDGIAGGERLISLFWANCPVCGNCSRFH